MTDTAARRRGAVLWCAASALLLLPALAGWWLGGPGTPPAIEWQRARLFDQPWRWWSAAWVHYSTLHLAANAAGALLVAALGMVARLPARAAVAWLAAWPLTHLALWLRPGLASYGGLSGVLHAGVAVVMVSLLHEPSTRRFGVVLGLGLLVKLLLESPWGPALRIDTAGEIATVPFAHAAGALVGTLCAALWLRGLATQREAQA